MDQSAVKRTLHCYVRKSGGYCSRRHEFIGTSGYIRNNYIGSSINPVSMAVRSDIVCQDKPPLGVAS